VTDLPDQVFIAAEDYDPKTGDNEANDIITREPWEATLSALAHKPGHRVSVPRSPDVKRTQVVNAFLDAFQLIGGTPRLALWGHENPTEFYKLWAKLTPRQVEQETKHEGGIVIKHILPRGKLDE
jgi:hypothetical protein